MKIKNIISVAILGLSVLMMTSCGGKQADQDVEAIVEFDEAKFLTNLETIENSLTVDAPAKNDLQKACIIHLKYYELQFLKYYMQQFLRHYQIPLF